MGLITTANGADDVDAVRVLANEVAALWNENGGKDFSFTLRVGRRNIQKCCDHGTKLLRRFCPAGNEPGPFKRVATLVVLSRLEPFFEITPPKSGSDKTQWLARISALLIPVALKALRVDVSGGKKVKIWERLDNWKGFPSPHFKADFLAWLSWMDTLCWLDSEFPEAARKEKWLRVKEDRIARMILVTALILESCYYYGEINSGVAVMKQICGKCRSFLGNPDLTSITYDSTIYSNYSKKPPRQ